MDELAASLLPDELVVADVSRPELEELVAGAQAPLVRLRWGTDALAMITAATAGARIRTLHLVAHGSVGRWSLAGRRMTRDWLESEAASLATWQVERIALWVCEAGADPALLRTLEHLTGARVYASLGPLGFVGSGRPRWSVCDAQGLAALHASTFLDSDVLAGWRHALCGAPRAGAVSSRRRRAAAAR